LLSSCNTTDKTTDAYINEINQWHRERIASLKENDSWLSLVGLYWLDADKNTFGSDSTNDIVFPGKGVPARMGWLELEDGTVRIHINPGVKVLTGGIPVTDTTMLSDAGGEPTVLSYGSLRWHIIERDNRLGVRLKDTNNPQITAFGGIKRFPVSARWRVKARYIQFEEPKTIWVPDILGFASKEPLYGSLEFELNGETYRLDPLGEPQDEELFVIFGDQTNGEETYGAGRFVYVPRPNEHGITWIDFNKAYNPPCVFNSFATCPLPPAQNVLPVKINAGEKNYVVGSMH
jgi:uncharacterized protein (DUF1684 family)